MAGGKNRGLKHLNKLWKTLFGASQTKAEGNLGSQMADVGFLSKTT